MSRDDAAVPLSLRLLGPFEVLVHGEPLLRLRFRKSQAVLALLVLRVGSEVEREWLAGLLWPDTAPAAGLHSVRNCLSDLRAALGPEASRLRAPTARTVSLDLSGASVDVPAFDAALTRGSPEALAEAVALYRGPLLEGWTEAWAFQERQAREQGYLRALETLAARAQARGELAEAERYLRAAVAVDPLRESAQRALMSVLAAGGNYTAVLTIYRELRLRLHREANSEPDPETQALFQRLQEAAQRGRSTSREELLLAAPDPPLAAPRSAFGLGPILREPPPAAAAPAIRAEARPTEALPTTPPGEEREDGEAATAGPAASPAPERSWLGEPTSGALPIDSPYYIARLADAEFEAAVDRQDGVILVKGARQMGKTSLLARGLHRARQAGAAIVLTDFRVLNAAQLASVEALFLALGEWMAQQLELDVRPREVWNDGCGPSINFDLYLRRQVLSRLAAPLLWGLDEADRLFSCDFAGEVFGLFRSWHNRRSLDPTGPWSRLTLALTYAAEAHLFITDLDQSPFNVGTHVALEPFELEQVAELNRRYQSPLRTAAEVSRFHDWMEGQPYLTHRGIQVMAARELDLASLEPELASEAGIFGDHLRRVLRSVTRDPELRDAVRQVLQDQPCPTAESFYRLRSAGVLAGRSAREARPRCRLYAHYLEEHLL